jgi:glycerophosphoryl diester phosphodiesterase
MRATVATSHAACKGHAPENTLAGIEAAIRLGADAIEIDVHCTSDGVPILLHDETVDRTTDGTGNVHEMPLAVVRTLDAGARQFVPKFQGERIPTLAEVLDVTKGKVLVQIEVKQADIQDAVVRAVHDAGAIADCEVHSFGAKVVKAFREREPRMAAALLTDGRRVVEWQDFFSFALSLGAQGVSVYYSMARPELVRAGQLRGLTYMVWTVDDEGDMANLVDAGVDSICSNFPDLVRRTVDGRRAQSASTRR